jgi:hypothetical protein
MFITYTIKCQIKFDIDSSTLVGKDKNVFSQRQIFFDKQNNRYLFGCFKGQLNIDTFTIETSLQVTNSPSADAGGVFIAKYNTNNEITSLQKIAEGDSLYNAAASIDNMKSEYFSISYAGKLYFGGDSTLSAGDKDVIVIVYDSLQQTRHVTKIGAINGEQIVQSGVSIDEDYNYYVSGIYNETWTNNFPNYKLGFGSDTLVATTMDIFIAKYDSNGNVLWVQSYGGIGQDFLTNLIYYNHNIYFIADLYQPGIVNNIGGINVTFPPNYDSKYILVKLDTAGNALWIKKYGDVNIFGGALSSICLAVIRNRIYTSGFSSSNSQNIFIFEGGPTLTGTSSFDYFIAGYDTSGNFKWNTIAKSPYSEYLNQLSADSLGNVYGIGNMVFSSYFPNDTLYTNGSDDVLLCSYDSNGNFRWATHGGGVSTDIGSSIALDNNGKIFIVGGTTSSGGCMMGNDTLYPPANQSTMFFASLDSIDATWPLQNTVQFHESFQIEVYPNPAYKYLYVDMKQVVTQTKNEHTLIKMQNALGQIVYITQVAENYSNTPNSLHTIDISSYPNGMYFLSLISDQQAISKKIIIQH